MPERGGRQVPEKRYTQAEVDAIAQAARTDQKAHDVKGTQQTRIAAEHMAERVAAAIVPHLAKPSGPVTSDVPVWLKIVGAVGGVVVSSAIIIGIVWNLAISPVTARLEILERARTDAATGLTSLVTRMQTQESKTQQIETSMSTATRIRDQQQQGMLDQIRQLAASDQNSAERLSNLANTIASILPRLEEILRRQERLESRLSMPLPRSQNDEPVTQTGPRERGI